jgi:hypothetical protein
MSKERDFKSYANAVSRSGCCCLCASLSTETLRKLRKTWDRASLRKETLKNRKEASFLKNCKGVRPSRIKIE